MIELFPFFVFYVFYEKEVISFSIYEHTTKNRYFRHTPAPDLALIVVEGSLDAYYLDLHN